MDQDKRGFPSIALRMALTKHGVTRKYLDKLSSPAPLYKNVRAMVRANFPALLRNRKLRPQEMSLMDMLQAIGRGENL